MRNQYDNLGRRYTVVEPPVPFDELTQRLLDEIDRNIGFVATARGRWRTEIEPAWIREVVVAPAIIPGDWHLGVAGNSLRNQLLSPHPISGDKVTDQLRRFGLESAAFRVRRTSPTASNPCLTWGAIRQASRKSTKDWSTSAVYFIQAETGGPIKIGIADNVPKRLNALQCGNPELLMVIGIIPDGGRKTEVALHRQFAKSLIRGEWFKPTPELIEHIHQSAIPYELFDNPTP